MKQRTRKIVTKAHALADYDEVPSHARITLEPGLIKRIKELRKALTSVEADFIESFNYDAEFLTQNEDEKLVEWTGTTECNRLILGLTGFWWKALIRHTNVAIETEEIPYSKITTRKRK
jgi:hypothetical protein